MSEIKVRPHGRGHYCMRCNGTEGGPFGHETSECKTEDERLAERARRIHGNPFSPENMARDAKLKGIERDAVPVERTIDALKRHQEEDE